jgi:hypothetical protein
MQQDRLFRLAVESGSLSFFHEPRLGWTLVVNLRRGDETWWETEPQRYSGLSTAELLDTVSACLDSAL